MIGAGHFHATEVFSNVSNACVVRGHDDFAQAPGLLALFDDMLDEWLASDERERFSGKASGSEAGRYDAVSAPVAVLDFFWTSSS
jgi:hypothetical protein